MGMFLFGVWIGGMVMIALPAWADGDAEWNWSNFVALAAWPIFYPLHVWENRS